MPDDRRRALSDILNQLENSVHGESVTVAEVIERLGQKSFASLMLVFASVSLSPASAIPGITMMVAAVVFILVAQMIIGRDTVWLPDIIGRRRMPSEKLCRGIDWLRRPVRLVERYLKARLTFLLHLPWLWPPLLLILVLTLFMPAMEMVPMSGSIASGVIVIFAAGLLTRDGALVLTSFVLLAGVSFTVACFAFS